MRRLVRSALVLLLTAPVSAQQASGVVTRVIDGDTVVVSGTGTVRLLGVDTPETVDPRKPVQYFGKEASAFTTRLLLRQTVRVAYDQQRTDKYRRTLAYLYLPDGTLANLEIIRQGYGHAYLTALTITCATSSQGAHTSRGKGVHEILGGLSSSTQQVGNVPG